jgi:hypothetical protein
VLLQEDSLVQVLLAQGLLVRVVSGTIMHTCRLGSTRMARMRGRGRLGGSKCECVWAHEHHVALSGHCISAECHGVS